MMTQARREGLMEVNAITSTNHESARLTHVKLPPRGSAKLQKEVGRNAHALLWPKIAEWIARIGAH